METLITTSLLILFVGVSFSQQARDKVKPLIVAGEGWGAVRLNAKRADVEPVIGKGENPETSGYVYYLDYTDLGIQVSFNITDDRVHTIYFYNKQRGDERLKVFDGETSKGISWSSSGEEVVRAYGKPKYDFGGKDSFGAWRRLVFEGIDFRFENKRMVRIGIPGI